MSYRVATALLDRCCQITIDAAMTARTPTEGDRLRCRYCRDPFGMIFMGGWWRWAGPISRRER